MMPNFAVSITTRSRSHILEQALKAFKRYTPPDVPVIVVGAVTNPPICSARFHFMANRGIAAGKNKCLELLDELPEEVEHFFLFDDDCFPVRNHWWMPYVESPEVHLQYQYHRLEAGPEWQIHEIAREENLIAYDNPSGGMLYIHRSVLPVVGGMHVAWGKHGGEHGDWSKRIQRAGLTRYAFADVPDRTLKCLDETLTGISSVPDRDKQHWRHVDAKTLPLYAEYREQPIPVLVPWRSDGGHRDALWSFVKDNFWKTQPDYRIVEGTHTEGTFNRSAALNLAARQAGNWDVAVIADADTWVPASQLQDAVAMARVTDRLVAAFTVVVELNQETTERILTGEAMDFPTFGSERVRYNMGTVASLQSVQSSMLVVPRTVFDRAGGFDEKFFEWGFEDVAFWKAASIVSGEPLRISGIAWHLWHAPSSVRFCLNTPTYQSNFARFRLYEHLKDENELRALRGLGVLPQTRGGSQDEWN